MSIELVLMCRVHSGLGEGHEGLGKANKFGEVVDSLVEMLLIQVSFPPVFQCCHVFGIKSNCLSELFDGLVVILSV
jgi:hypothetical protein